MRNKEYWLKWLKAAGLRAVRTFAQAFIGAIGAAVFMDEVQWLQALSAAGLATVLSILMSISGLPEVEEIPEEVDEDE